MSNKILFAAALLAFIVMVGPAHASTNINSCGTLNTNGELYILTANITANTNPCITITADNITVDGGNNSIDGYVNHDTVFFLSGRINTTIRYININTSAVPHRCVELAFSYNTMLRNVTCYSKDYIGIDIYGSGGSGAGSNYTTITNSNITAPYGIELIDNSKGTVINNTRISDGSGYCIKMEAETKYNTFYNNIFNCTVTLNGIIMNNTFNNSLAGNYWGNPSRTGFSDTCTDADYNGICDSEYAITADARDYMPKSLATFGPVSSPITIIISSPANTSYYSNHVNTSFNVTSQNLTAIPCWLSLDGNVSALGNITNGTVWYNYTYNGTGAHVLNITCGLTTNYSSQVNYFTYTSENNVTLTASPGWSINDGDTATINCSSDLGTPSLTINGNLVASYYSFTATYGIYAVACTSPTVGSYGSNITAQSLSVGMTTFGCFNATIFIWSKAYGFNSSVGNITLDFSTLVASKLVSPDLHDVYVSNSSVNGTWRNGSYLIVNTTYAKNITVYFGNYFATQAYNSGGNPVYVYNVASYNQDHPYLEVTIKSEETGAEQLPPSANITLVYGCDTGTTIGQNVTNTTIYTPTVRAKFDYVQAFVNYAGGVSYARQLLVSAANANKDMYLADAKLHSILQVPVYMTDPLYYSSYASVYRNLGGVNIVITEGYFDVEHKFTSYIIKDVQYLIRVTKGLDIREIGFLYASVATSQYISVTTFNTVPTLALLQGNLRMWTNFDNVTGVLTSRYEDRTGLTTSVRIRVYENLNASTLYDNTFMGSSNVTVTINGLNGSRSYYVQFSIDHPQFGNSLIEERLAAYVVQQLVDLALPAGMTWLYSVFGFIIMGFVGFISTPRLRLGGLIFMGIIFGVMVGIRWFNFAWPMLGMIAVFIVLGILHDQKRGGGA